MAAARVLPSLEQSQNLTASTEVFQKEFHTYMKAVEHDLLFHHDMYAAFTQHLQQRFAGGAPIHFVDLGCGDATHPAAVLRKLGADLQLASYTGVDVSSSALAAAAEQLAWLGEAGGPQRSCSLVLEQADMKEWVEQRCKGGKYDVILQSYSLHHLTREGKEHYLSFIAQGLREGGEFFLIDIYKPEGDDDSSVEQYNDRVRAKVLASALEEEEKASIVAHATTFDLPEKLSTYESMALSAGFSSVNVLQTRGDMYCAMALKK